MTKRDHIRQLALDVLDEHPGGLRYSQLVEAILARDPSLKRNTIVGSVWNLDQIMPGLVCKPSRGVFQLVKHAESADGGSPDVETLASAGGRSSVRGRQRVRRGRSAAAVPEEAFYKPFARWLIEDVEECTKAIPLGGNRFRDKWGTPDVIGLRESRRSDLIKAPTEIICAEIKGDTNQLVTAFGQACAYGLISHKTYLVVPRTASEGEISRLDTLCQIFGVGLVLFDATNPENPEFTIRTRPAYRQPDLFYANRYLSRIEPELFS